MKNIAALLVVLLSAAPVRAIELSLEENRAERGSVGYVDMQRLFTNSPDAQHAKESFEELIRQAEERVNLRKAELLKLHQSLDKLRAERDEVVASSMTAPAPVVVPPPAPAPAVSVATVTAAAPAVSVATVAAVVAAVAPPASAPSASTATVAAKVPTLPLALPGMTPTAPTPAAPPAATPAPVASTGTNAGLDGLLAAKVSAPVAPPSAVAVATAAAPSPAPAPAVPAAPVAPAGPTLGQRLLELDAKIISLQSDVSHKEDELTREHDEADRGLLDIESRKTDQVLARLYRAITEVAHAEGVSVVVDKTTILYGHPAVDITDKVLKHLKEAPQP